MRPQCGMYFLSYTTVVVSAAKEDRHKTTWPTHCHARGDTF
ncbi:hypothetical protein GQ600_3301 [Phytophthora cactorum]|nr:hypothetical protein GQ600_3301 [Phytophthora cactorum]